MPGRPTNEPDNYFAIGKQSAKDTEATTFHFLKHLDGTGLERDDNIESVREGGDGPEVGLRYRTAVSLDGAANANARPELAARLLAYVLHSDTVTDAASGFGATEAQVHTAVPTHRGPSNPYYLTLEQAFADEIERVSNALVTTLTIEGEQGRPVKMSAEFLGGGTPYHRESPASSLTPTRESAQPYFFPNASVVLDGAANSKITKFKQTIRRGVDADIRTTSLHREDVVSLTFDTDLEFTLKYEDRTLYRKVHANGGTQVPLQAIDLATGAFKFYSEFGAGTTLRFFETNQPVFEYVGARVNKLDPDGKTMYIDVTAMGIKGATHQFFSRVQTASGGAF